MYSLSKRRLDFIQTFRNDLANITMCMSFLNGLLPGDTENSRSKLRVQATFAPE
jgi:hypothetical protein